MIFIYHVFVCVCVCGLDPILIWSANHGSVHTKVEEKIWFGRMAHCKLNLQQAESGLRVVVYAVNHFVTAYTYYYSFVFISYLNVYQV